MPEMLAQPDAAEIPAPLIDLLVRHARPSDTEHPRYQVVQHDGHTNDVAEVRFADGRILMVKRGRYAWSVPRFRSSRAAAALLSGSGIMTPVPLEVPVAPGPRPLEAYWRVPHATLAELWPVLGPSQQRQALLSWGELVARLHRVQLADHGPLGAETPQPCTLSEFLAEDLGSRLAPAIAGVWPAALPLVETLCALIPELESRTAVQGALLHGDLHMGNVLCELHDDHVRCVGLLDLETAHAGPPESDLARLEITNSALFGYPMPAGSYAAVLEGYGGSPDAVVLAFFRVYHYLNLGFHSQLVGHEWHAGEIARLAGADGEHLLRLLEEEPQRIHLPIAISR